MMHLEQNKQQHCQLCMPSVAATTPTVCWKGETQLLKDISVCKRFHSHSTSLSWHKPPNSITALSQQLRSSSARSMTHKRISHISQRLIRYTVRWRLFRKKQAESEKLPPTPAALSWPSNSPDLNPVDNSMWEMLQEKVYKTRIDLELLTMPLMNGFRNNDIAQL